jgi:hypothetical protein
MGEESTALRRWDQLHKASSRHEQSARKALKIIQGRTKDACSVPASIGENAKSIPLEASAGHLPMTCGKLESVMTPCSQAPTGVSIDIARKQLLLQLTNEAPVKRKQALLDLKVRDLAKEEVEL